jgi:hypothetical protein
MGASIEHVLLLLFKGKMSEALQKKRFRGQPEC